MPSSRLKVWGLVGGVGATLLTAAPSVAELPVVPTRPEALSARGTPLPLGLRPHVLGLALRAYECGRLAGHFDRPVLALIDYSRPSDERRLWVIDVETGIVLFHEYVAHGQRSGERYAVLFSNVSGSRRSSIGLFRTANTYAGSHGYSLNLVGLEPGTNDRALERRIVMHGADYVGPEIALAQGRVGRSWGCPAVDSRIHHAVIDRIKDGGALFVYYPDTHWLRRSRFFACSARPDRTTAWRARGVLHR
jgi:hypothetical protein